MIRQELAILRSKGDLTPALRLKDPYGFDFLGFTDRLLECDMEDAMLRELETFLLDPACAQGVQAPGFLNQYRSR